MSPNSIRPDNSSLAFYDDALLHNRKDSIIPFLEQIISRFGKRRLAFHTPNAVHIDSVDRETARLMFDAGFVELRFGLESTTPEFHTRTRTKVHLERVGETVEVLKAAGFKGSEITAYVLLGVPGESFDGVLKTLRDVERLGINVGLSEYSPVPGTELYPAAREESGLDLDGEPLYHNNSVFSLLGGLVSADQLATARSLVRSIRRTLAT